MKEETKTKLNEQIEEKINQIVNEKINASNIDMLDKIVDIYKDIKEVECMNYGNYGNSYGRPGYDSYGRRGYDMKYRGNESLDRMAGEYGRYMESYGRYGHGEESDKSFHYMVESLKDFIKVLYEEAQTPQQKQMLQESLQKSMMM